MFIAALFIIAKTWKKPKSLSQMWYIQTKSLNQMWYIQTMEYYSGILKNVIIQSFEMSYEKPGKDVEET